MKSSFNLVLAFCAITAVILLAAGPAAVESATCSVTELTPCAPAILGSAAPTTGCCSAMSAQASCFCEYKKNPAYSVYFSGGQKVAATCGVTIPDCP